MSLTWEFYSSSTEWMAASGFKKSECPRDWCIVVCDDGSFDVSESDESLLPSRKVACFPNLKAAKQWCEDREQLLLEDERSHEPARDATFR